MFLKLLKGLGSLYPSCNFENFTLQQLLKKSVMYFCFVHMMKNMMIHHWDAEAHPAPTPKPIPKGVGCHFQTEEIDPGSENDKKCSMFTKNK